MTIPPGLAPSDFEDALKQLRRAVGVDWVFTSAEDLSTYRDPFSVLRGTPLEPEPAMAVVPHTVAQVQEVVRIANRFKIITWTISTGKNFGYGGPSALHSGSMIIDLKRLDRVLDVNEEHAYALVEPGVSQYDLLREIRRRGYKLWIDGPSPAWASVLASTLERGVGYGLAGDRVSHICGLEVVLPNGDLIRTGMGGVEKSGSWQQYPYGFGPWIDGMFTQSNFGIVTKLGIWLIPEPPSFRQCLVTTPDHNAIVPLLDTMRPLRLQGVVRNAVSYHPTMPDLWDPKAPYMPPDNVTMTALGAGRAPVGWTGRLGFYGEEKAVEADYERMREALIKNVPGVQFKTKTFAAPYEIDQWHTDEKMAAGIPSFQEGPYFPHDAMLLMAVVPNTGKDYVQFKSFAHDFMRSVGLTFFGGPIHNHVPRALIGAVVLPSGSADSAANLRRLEQAKDYAIEAAKRGYALYRAEPLLMAAAAKAFAFNNHALMRFYEGLKDAIDPNGVVSPGKSGIEPKRMRT